VARFPSGKVISVLNRLTNKEVLLGFRSNFFQQNAPGWVPEVHIEVPQAVSKGTLDNAIQQIREAAGLDESDIMINVNR
jgi:hypothetical protein